MDNEGFLITFSTSLWVRKSAYMYVDLLPSDDIKYRLTALDIGLLDMRTINNNTQASITS